MLDFEVKNITPMEPSKEIAIKAAGSYAAQEYKDCVNTEGYGKWEPIRVVTRTWRASKGTKPLSFLSNFAKYKITGDKLEAGFIKGPKVDQHFTNIYINRNQEGYDQPVTAKMRGYFARKQFPLKANILRHPSRPITELVEGKIAKNISEITANAFARSYENEN